MKTAILFFIWAEVTPAPWAKLLLALAGLSFAARALVLMVKERSKA